MTISQKHTRFKTAVTDVLRRVKKLCHEIKEVSIISFKNLEIKRVAKTMISVKK